MLLLYVLDCLIQCTYHLTTRPHPRLLYIAYANRQHIHTPCVPSMLLDRTPATDRQHIHTLYQSTTYTHPLPSDNIYTPGVPSILPNRTPATNRQHIHALYQSTTYIHTLCAFHDASSRLRGSPQKACISSFMYIQLLRWASCTSTSPPRCWLRWAGNCVVLSSQIEANEIRSWCQMKD